MNFLNHLNVMNLRAWNVVTSDVTIGKPKVTGWKELLPSNQRKKVKAGGVGSSLRINIMQRQHDFRKES